MPVTRHISETVQDTITLISRLGFLLSTDPDIMYGWIYSKGTPEIFEGGVG